ncbi:MAG TPA: hypothetical protein VM286_05965 [Candidatus Thermoplasmatota archaeon]|nr:hypothetical protein [Candidatus Thermoplasmatota archaeon]
MTRALAAAAFLLLLLPGCASPKSPDATTTTTQDSAPTANNPLIKVVQPKTAPALHLLQAPTMAWESKGGEAVRSPFTGVPAAGQGSVEWSWDPDRAMTLFAGTNWTVWVEVPAGAYNSLDSCPWGFSLEVRTKTSSSSSGSNPKDCSGSSLGPAEAGRFRLDGTTGTFLQGKELAPGDSVRLRVSCNLVLPPNSPPVVALGGAPGVDSQLVLHAQGD